MLTCEALGNLNIRSIRWCLVDNLLLVATVRSLRGNVSEFTALGDYFSVRAELLGSRRLPERKVYSECLFRLPMAGNYSVFCGGICLFKVSVITRAPDFDQSFAKCFPIVGSDTLITCSFHRVAVDRATVVFYCDRCTLDKAFEMSMSFTRYQKVRLVISRGEIHGPADSGLVAVLVDVDWNRVFYHYQVESVLPIFRLLVDHNVTTQPKILLSARLPTQLTQLTCFGFQNFSTSWGNHSRFPLLVAGLRTRSNTKGSDHRNYCQLLLFDRLEEWRAVHSQCFLAFHNSSHTQKRIVILNRPEASHRTILNLPVLVRSIKQLKTVEDWELVSSDLVGLNFREQYLITSSARVLVSIHGSGLAHFLFMVAGSLIVEISPYLFAPFHNFSERALCAGMRHKLVEVSANNSYPRSARLRTEVEMDLSLLEHSFRHRQNVRDQNVELSRKDVGVIRAILERAFLRSQ